MAGNYRDLVPFLLSSLSHILLEATTSLVFAQVMTVCVPISKIYTLSKSPTYLLAFTREFFEAGDGKG